MSHSTHFGRTASVALPSVGCTWHIHMPWRGLASGAAGCLQAGCGGRRFGHRVPRRRKHSVRTQCHRIELHNVITLLTLILHFMAPKPSILARVENMQCSLPSTSGALQMSTFCKQHKGGSSNARVAPLVLQLCPREQTLPLVGLPLSSTTDKGLSSK